MANLIIFEDDHDFALKLQKTVMQMNYTVHQKEHQLKTSNNLLVFQKYLFHLHIEDNFYTYLINFHDAIYELPLQFPC